MQQYISLLISQNLVFALYFIPVWGLKKLLGSRLYANTQYVLWLPFVLGLLIPVKPWPLALYPAMIAVDMPALLPLAVWATGAGITAWCFLFGRLRLHHVLLETAVPGSPVTESLYHSECKRLQIPKRMPAMVQCAVASPGIYGIVKRTIVLPEDIDVLEPYRIRHILTHELIHHKKGDPIVCALLNLLCVVCWFNPIVWIAAGCVRSDMELACDESLLRNLGRSEHQDYGRTLIEYASRFDGKNGFSLYPAFGNRLIGRRISLIKRTPASTLTLRMLGVMAVLALFLCFMLTSASFSISSSVPSSTNLWGNHVSSSQVTPAYRTS